jgi:hypothetical protein
MKSGSKVGVHESAGTLPVWSGGGGVRAEWSRDRIVEALVREARVGRDAAERLSQSVELERVFALGYDAGRASAAPAVKPATAPQKQRRPPSLAGTTYQMDTGCGPLYVTINESGDGPFELFTTMGKAGGCASSQCEAIGRMISMAWRSGLDPRPVVKQLVGISCHQPGGLGGEKVLSCADAVAKAIMQHLDHGAAVPGRQKRA